MKLLLCCKKIALTISWCTNCVGCFIQLTFKENEYFGNNVREMKFGVKETLNKLRQTPDKSTLVLVLAVIELLVRFVPRTDKAESFHAQMEHDSAHHQRILQSNEE